MLDERSRAEQFPSLSRMTYLNTAAEGIPSLAVHDALERYWQDKLMGMAGRDRHFPELEKARTHVAAMYGLSRDEVSICSCSSEAYNLLANALALRDGDEVVINDLDFPAGATPWLTSGCPATVRLWKSRAGSLHPEDLAPLLSSRTRLVQTSLVSFLNGFKIDLPAVAAVVRRHCQALLSVDVTQALGRIVMNLDDADVIVSSTHKWILATHGGGLVGVRKRAESRLQARAGGWFNLEDAFGANRFESARPKAGAAGFSVGMPNFPAVYAIAAALQYIQQVGVDRIEAATRPIMRQCLDELAKLPVELMTPANPEHLAGIVAFRHPRMDVLNLRLVEAGIHVMAQQGRMRISVHGYNTSADVERCFAALREALNDV